MKNKGDLLGIGGPLAATQVIEKLFSKPDFGSANGPFFAGNVSIEVGPPESRGFPEDGSAWTPKVGF